MNDQDRYRETLAALGEHLTSAPFAPFTTTTAPLEWVRLFACGCRVQGAQWDSCGRHTTQPQEWPVDEDRLRAYLATELWP